MAVVRLLLYALSVSVALSAPALAQQRGAIAGRVLDPDGLALPGATVVVTNPATGFTREVVTAETGGYSVPALEPGTYDVKVEMPGFGGASRTGLVLAPGGTITLELKLTVAGVQENLVVTGESPLVERASNQIGGSLSRREIEEVPSNFRNFTGLTQLIPGMTPNPATSTFEGGQVVANGSPSQQNVYLLDGMYNNDDRLGGSQGTQVRVVLDNIEEYQVLANQYSSEYGGGAGAIINMVTRGGTNQLHGRAYSYFRDETLNARDKFLASGQDKPPVRTLQAGPVTRDFLRRQVTKQISGDATDNGSHPVTKRFYNNELTPGKTPQEFLDQELGGLTLSCGQMWSITEHAIIEHSKEIIEKANVMHLKGQLADTPENRDMMCRELAMKLSRDWNRFEGGGSNCDLVEVVSVNMFKTALSRMPLSEKIKQKKDRMALVGRTNDMMALDNLGNKDHSSRLITPKDGKAMQVKLNDLGQTVVRDLNAEARNGDGQEVWRPFVSIDLESFSDTAFGHQQRTMSRNLMQGIYSYAMNLPYYQGMLLYLLSMAYPFMCILVIIPSRAMSFLLCPLMWLWVKSWDVGFAIVIILDKVLWNLLPSSDVPYQPLSGDTADMTGVVAAAAGEATRLPEILNSALSVDPSYNILAHFNFVSIALMSVPAFTGFAILKARKSILSSFTDGPKQIAQEAGDMAFSAHNTNISNIQRDKLHRFAGAALQASSDWGEGLFGGGRMQSFLGYGAKKFAANASPKNGGDIVNQFIPRRSSEAIKAELEGVKKSVESATGRTKAILERRVEKLGGELKNAERKDDFLPKDKKAKDGKVDWKKVKRDALYNAWEAMEKGASTGFEIVMAEQAAAARKSWALDDDLGFFGYYSNRMRGVIAGTDGTGGFELEDIDVGGTVAQSQFDLTWRMIDTGYEITGDVIKTVFSNQLENLDDPFIKKMVYNASAGEAALTVNSVEQAFGGASDVHNFIDESKMEYRRRSDENYKKQWEDFFGTDYEKMREQRLEEQEEERKKERHFEEERSKPAKKK